MGMDIPVRDIGFQASEGVFGIPLHRLDGAVPVADTLWS